MSFIDKVSKAAQEIYQTPISDVRSLYYCIQEKVKPSNAAIGLIAARMFALLFQAVSVYTTLKGIVNGNIPQVALGVILFAIAYDVFKMALNSTEHRPIREGTIIPSVWNKIQASFAK